MLFPLRLKKIILIGMLMGISTASYADWPWKWDFVQNICSTVKNNPLISVATALIGTGLLYAAWSRFKKQPNAPKSSGRNNTDLSRSSARPKTPAAPTINEHQTTAGSSAPAHATIPLTTRNSSLDTDRPAPATAPTRPFIEPAKTAAELELETKYPHLAQLRIGDSKIPFFQEWQTTSVQTIRSLNEISWALRQTFEENKNPEPLNEFERFVEMQKRTLIKRFGRKDALFIHDSISCIMRRLRQDLGLVRDEKKWDEFMVLAQKQENQERKLEEQQLDQKADEIIKKGNLDDRQKLLNQFSAGYLTPEKCSMGSDKNNLLLYPEYVIACMIMGYKNLAFQFHKTDLRPWLLASAKVHNIMFIAKPALMFTPAGLDDAFLAAKLPNTELGSVGGAVMGYLLGYGEDHIAASDETKKRAKDWIRDNRPGIRKWAAENVEEYEEIMAQMARIPLALTTTTTTTSEATSTAASAAAAPVA